ncbi:MAG: hypothetical protein DMF78_22730 [Acidobacteria bacterium]|nr:MAG: hypothetical protein DMF78_22730 [Acidobacteriota bacterium]
MAGGSDDGARDVPARVSQARELAARGQLDEALVLLRAVLYEDIDCAAAQAAVQDVRRAWLARAASAGPAMRADAAPAVGSPVGAPEAVPTRAASPPVTTGAPPGRRGPSLVALFAVLALVLAMAAVFAPRRRPLVTPSPTSTLAPAPVAAATTPWPAVSEPPGGQDDTGPLAGIDPALRDAIRATLTLYGRALQRADLALLAQARPDLSEEARAQAVAPFRGALNVTTQLRVVEVAREGDRARVPILRRDVVIGGRGADAPPVRETLSFRRRGGAWALEK